MDACAKRLFRRAVHLPRHSRHVRGGIRSPDDLLRLQESRIVEVRRCLLDMVAKRGEPLRRRPRRRCDLRVDLHAGPGLCTQSDAQPLRPVLDDIEIGDCRRRDFIAVAGIRAMAQVEQGCGIAHRAGEHEGRRQAQKRRIGIGRSRHPATRRLQSDQPAERGRISDRSATVAALRKRHDAGRDSRRRPATGTGHAARRVPRIACGAIKRRFRRRRHAELGTRRSPGIDQAGRAQARPVHGIVTGAKPLRQAATELGGPPRLDGKVLGQRRNATEGRGGPGLGQAVQRIRIKLDDGVQRGIDRRNRFLDAAAEFPRRDFPLRQEAGEAGAVMGGVFVKSHDVIPIVNGGLYALSAGGPARRPAPGYRDFAAWPEPRSPRLAPRCVPP